MKGRLLQFPNSSRLFVIAHEHGGADFKKTYIELLADQTQSDVLEIMAETGYRAKSLEDQATDIQRLISSTCNLAVAPKAPNVPGRKWNEIPLGKIPVSERSTEGGYTAIFLIGHRVGAMILRLAVGQEAARRGSACKWLKRIRRFVLLGCPGSGISPEKEGGMSYLKWQAMNVAGVLFGERLLPRLYQARPGSVFTVKTRLLWLEGVVADIIDHIQIIACLGNQDNSLSFPELNDYCFGVGKLDRVLVVFERTSARNYLIRENPNAANSERCNELVRLLLDDLKGETTLDEVNSTDGSGSSQIRRAAMVVHGIRDKGKWSSKLAYEIRSYAARRRVTLPVIDGSYGYLPFVNFVIPFLQQKSTEWMMDNYCSLRGLYPAAAISYVGHSNGTLLLCEALRQHGRHVRFDNVVLAAAVVRKDYPWAEVLQEGRVSSVRNYVATHDFVVAILAKGQRWVSWMLGGVRGGAGHEGFQEGATGGFSQFVPRRGTGDKSNSRIRSYAAAKKLVNVRHAVGGHSAAIREEYWEEIARFVVEGPGQETYHHVEGQKEQGPIIKVASALSGLLYAFLMVFCLVYLLVLATPIIDAACGNGFVSRSLQMIASYAIGKNDVPPTFVYGSMTGPLDVSGAWSGLSTIMQMVVWAIMSLLGYWFSKKL